MSIYDTLNEKQREAVFHTEGPQLILAGAGSGKTRVLTHRIAYLIDEIGVNPWHIMAITFTNKAAGEMRERVDKLVGFGSESIWVSTFHSTCVRLLRRHIDLLGFDTNFTIYDTDDQKTVMKDVCKRLQIDPKRLKERTIMNAISSAKDELIGPIEFQMKHMGDLNFKKIGEAYALYQETLKKSNALDFDDLICKTVELLKANPDVLENYQRRFEYIMVDEYQDTNTAQFELIRLLAGGKNNLCVVGDDDQSIYKFRGANIRNILDFEKTYPGAHVVKLEQNYRSTQNILDAANAVISHNIGRKQKSLWTDQGAGSRIHFHQFENAYEEADFIAGDIWSKCRNDGASYGDFAILYRTNAQARLLEERMVSKGMPYDVVGGTNFYARREIKDVLAYLKTIDNGKDDVAVKRIINIPKRGIGATTIARVQDYADMRGISFYDALCQASSIDTLGRAAAKLEPFVTLIQSFRAKQEFLSVREQLEDVLDCINYRDYLLETDDEDGEDRVENVEELISKMADYEESTENPSLSEFLEQVSLVADIDSVEDDGNHIVLMTLHSAKGLEFPQVYLAGLEDGVFPSYMTIVSDDPAEIEEERRLAYVGITRAKEELTITCAKSRMLRGETQYNPVSRFVKEIPSAYLDGYIPKKRSYMDSYEAPASPVRKTSLYGGTINLSQNRSAAYGQNRGTGSYGSGSYGTGGGSGSYGTGSYGSGSYGTVNGRGSASKAERPSLSSIPGLSKGMPGANGSGTIQKPEYGVGDRVKHSKFGEGTVLVLEKGPRDYQVTVEFDTAGKRVMYASFAKMQKI